MHDARRDPQLSAPSAEADAASMTATLALSSSALLMGALGLVPLSVFPASLPMNHIMDALHPLGGLLLTGALMRLLCVRSARGMLVAALIALTLAGMLELVQSVTGRTGSWSDLGMSGVGVGVAVAGMLPRRILRAQSGRACDGYMSIVEPVVLKRPSQGRGLSVSSRIRPGVRAVRPGRCLDRRR